MKVFVVGSYYDYGYWLTNDITNKIEEADLVIFCGGSDVDPLFYGEPFGKRIRFDTERDLDEFLVFNECVRLDKPMLGICRGSQLLCVANNGKLIQDVTNHALSNTHKIVDLESKEIYDVTSTHHQMAYPFDLPEDSYKIIATSEIRLSDHYLDGYNNKYNVNQILCEPEVIFYPKTRCLGIQYHPEYMRSNSASVKYTKELINKYLLPEDNQLDLTEEIIDKED